jgi:Mg2+-importing ATPase
LTSDTADWSDWWARDAASALADAQATPGGLSSGEARERLARLGANRLPDAHRSRVFAEIAHRLANPLVLVLLVAGLVAAVTGEAASTAIIVAVLVLSILLDHVQQRRAESAVKRLAQAVALRARVLRDGLETEVPVADLVAGDVVKLAAGSLVPADGLLLQSQDLFVQQSALTGESFPVERTAGDHEAGATMEQSRSALFMGTSIVSGMGTMLVCRTGAQTQIGGISHAVSRDRGELAFEADLRSFGTFILKIALLLVLFVLLVSGIAHRPWLESFLFALALAVGITPELLPMVVTLSLSRGALRLARQQVIVKRLPAIHNLGSMDVLCTDKTGTLTEARIALVRQVDIAGQDSALVLEGVFLNSWFESGIRTPLEDAVLTHGGVDVAVWRKIDEIPFDFERRRLSVLLEREGERRLVVKGAPADVLAHCDRFQSGEVCTPWNEAAMQQAQATLHALESGGFRVLGVASKVVPASLEDADLKDENELVFLGFAAFLDPPRADAHTAIADLLTKGVQVKVVTGDSELVTQHVCEALGLRVKGILLGSEIEAMDDRALARRVLSANLYCRVNPMQKERVIRALRARGHVVGYLGDGINDAPALHSADVGISVDTAVDTARAAADLIMLRHGLDVLSAAISEGRRTFANTRKYLLLGTSSNFGNMASMAAAALFLPFLPMLPVQVLLNNLLYDSVSAAIPLDRVEAAETTRAQHWDMARLRRFMFVIGPVSSLFDIATFFLLLHVLGSAPAQFQSGWFIESLATQVLAIFIIRTRGPAWPSNAHPALVAAAVAVLALAAALPFTPAGRWFGLVPLPPVFYGALAAMTLAYLAVLEWAKRRFWRAERRHRTG